MGHKLSKYEQELYQRVDEVLHYLWDPIAVSDIPEARGEYYSYLPHVFSLLTKTKDGKDISEYLLSVEKDKIGTFINDRIKDRAAEIAEILINYREWIKEKAEQSA